MVLSFCLFIYWINQWWGNFIYLFSEWRVGQSLCRIKYNFADYNFIKLVSFSFKSQWVLSIAHACSTTKIRLTPSVICYLFQKISTSTIPPKLGTHNLSTPSNKSPTYAKKSNSPLSPTNNHPFTSNSSSSKPTSTLTCTQPTSKTCANQNKPKFTHLTHNSNNKSKPKKMPSSNTNKKYKHENINTDNSKSTTPNSYANTFNNKCKYFFSHFQTLKNQQN